MSKKTKIINKIERLRRQRRLKRIKKRLERRKNTTTKKRRPQRGQTQKPTPKPSQNTPKVSKNKQPNWVKNPPLTRSATIITRDLLNSTREGSTAK